MDAVKYRSWVYERQGLSGAKYASARCALAGAGWQRSVGGVSPYVAIRARSGESRAAVDTLAAALELFELPAARACTYVLPAEHFALGLAAARPHSAITEVATARKLGCPDAEIDVLKGAVLEVLAQGAMAPADMKPFLGDLVRNFGEEGKKKGLTTSLPLALSLLQTEGLIRRKPVNGRFDVQRYSYELWQPPLTGFPNESEVQAELAALFFGWIGAATLKEFRDFTLLSVKAAKLACDAAGIVPFKPDNELLCLPSGSREYAEHTVASTPRYALVGSLDTYLLLRRGSQFWLADEDRGNTAPTERGIKPIGDLTELSSHAILDRGRLIGIWEFDVAEGNIAWTCWVKDDDALLSAVSEMEKYVIDELGDARSFSLDSPKSREPKITAIRAMKGA